MEQSNICSCRVGKKRLCALHTVKTCVCGCMCARDREMDPYFIVLSP